MKGDVVIVPFPFSDENTYKRRPAYVASNTHKPIFCQITSSLYPGEHQLALASDDFIEGGLKFTSIVNTSMIFTLTRDRILFKVGTLHPDTIKEIERYLVKIFTS